MCYKIHFIWISCCENIKLHTNPKPNHLVLWRNHTDIVQLGRKIGSLLLFDLFDL